VAGQTNNKELAVKKPPTRMTMVASNHRPATRCLAARPLVAADVWLGLGSGWTRSAGGRASAVAPLLTKLIQFLGPGYCSSAQPLRQITIALPAF
jgi:hypothetical protein